MTVKIKDEYGNVKTILNVVDVYERVYTIEITTIHGTVIHVNNNSYQTWEMQSQQTQIPNAYSNR